MVKGRISIARGEKDMAQILTSVLRALEVLDFFTVEEHELTLTEISKRMGMHKSSVYRILRTLESADLLQRDEATGKYRLSLKILELAGRVLGRYDLRSTAGPPMEELASKTGEIIHLSILDGKELVYLDKKGTGQVLTVSTKIGGKHPAYASAMGKVLLAHLPSEEIDKKIEELDLVPLTEHTITNPVELKRELIAIRDRGYALDNEEAFPGIRCIAAPIRDQAGKVVAAVSATVPLQRFDDDRIPKLAGQLMETASKISNGVVDSNMEV